MSNRKVVCENPTTGKKPTRIDEWKYNAVRDAILEVVPTKGDGIPFKTLPEAVADALSPDDRARLGSVAWYTVSVKLDMEVKGQLVRNQVAGRQHLLQS